MRNADVFNDADMVVSVTQKTINDQLARLVAQGTIRRELVLVQTGTDPQGNYTYEVVPSGDQIPKDPNGNPTVAYIDAAVQPQINIPASGTDVTFVLKFPSGTAHLWMGEGPAARLQSFDMTGWSYGVSIGLDLYAVAGGDLGRKIAVPQQVGSQLNDFVSNMFTVSALFMDFESADLLNFDATQTDVKEAGDKGRKQLTEFMQFYLKNLGAGGNPYILGYSLTTNDQTRVPDDQNVPDILQPVGTTFTLYHDPNNPDWSTLNFVLATKGGHGAITGSAGPFDSNWIGVGEPCDAKLIYSHSCLLEEFVLKPVFDTIRQGVYSQISQHISVGEGNDYDAAKQFTGNGWNFAIAAYNSGDDQYQNTYSVSIANQGTAVQFNFNGHIGAYKAVSKDNFFCTARAHASGTVDWSGTVTLTTTRDANGQPSLAMSQSFRTDNTSTDHDKNSCADAFSWIGTILGGILDVFTLFQDGGYFSNLFADLFSVGIPGIGNLDIALDRLSDAARNVILLPAGGVFSFQNPASDSEGNVSLELNYQA